MRSVPLHSLAGLRLEGKRVAFTSPSLYASRLQRLLLQEGAITLSCPSIFVEATPQNREALQNCLCRSSPLPFSGIAFTSRAGIKAVAEVLSRLFAEEDNGNPSASRVLEDGFFVSALGRDAELLLELDMFGASRECVRVIVPSIATPQAMVEEIGDGYGRRILCPVPHVEGLEEPPVVPEFLEALAARGWQPYRLDAYSTRWAGAECARPLLPLGKLDALIFTSTAEVEGFLKSLRALGITRIRTAGKPILAAHGPVTATGAARLGIEINVVSKDFSSFDGIMDELELYWRSSSKH
ncbi:hypothetical protein GOP47_0007967 [Adiantum capillus-veneris]|uniref:Tetrapyrrole biosynthesis uroporphyrinogen III synthase domain-containing protein n=1 Tax=Adiantum capillus-veneris TaxID=13818 RepID=A0A9D4ZJR4_ADICA|nr:hypothetical protein GOP47_0007967 [Adiantum capillus-veneris]